MKFYLVAEDSAAAGVEVAVHAAPELRVLAQGDVVGLDNVGGVPCLATLLLLVSTPLERAVHLVVKKRNYVNGFMVGYCTHLIIGFALVSTKEARCGFVASCALYRSPVIPLDGELPGAGLVPPADVLVLVRVLVLPEAAVVVAAC